MSDVPRVLLRRDARVLLPAGEVPRSSSERSGVECRGCIGSRCWGTVVEVKVRGSMVGELWRVRLRGVVLYSTISQKCRIGRSVVSLS